MRDRLQTVGRVLRLRSGLFALGLAALLVLGGVAGAAIPDSDAGEIHACFQKNQGHLRVIDAEEGAACRPSEEPLVWNQEGPQGEPGPQGDVGPRGPSDAFSRWHDPEAAVTQITLAGSLLELDVPDGNFAVTTTLIVRNAGAGQASVTCRTLLPSGDFDLARATLTPSGQGGTPRR
jgi:hypothetical protein